MENGIQMLHTYVAIYINSMYSTAQLQDITYKKHLHDASVCYIITCCTPVV